jgi:hypothetical protein
VIRVAAVVLVVAVPSSVLWDAAGDTLTPEPVELGAPEYASTDQLADRYASQQLTEPPAPPPPPTTFPSDPRGIIRAVFPDAMEATALRVCECESRFVTTARNYCCHGLFQIHWTSWRALLRTELGVTDVSQLYDAATNARAALLIASRYGWDQWQCY